MSETARITVIMEKGVYDKMLEVVPRGYRQHVINPVIELVVDAIKDQGPIVIGAIMSGQFKLVRDEPIKPD